MITRLLALGLLVVAGLAGPLVAGRHPASTEDLCAPILERYVMAPSSRQVQPAGVARIDANGGRVEQAEGLLALGGDAARIERLPGSDPVVVVDFGKDVSGRLTIRTTSSTSPELGVAFSESLAFLSKDSDISWQTDHTYTWRPAAGPGQFQTGQATFRYVMLFLTDDGRVDVDDLELTFTPFLGTPDTFAGCFAASDEQLTRIWYAGAYTLDLDTTAPDATGASVILDGAKRDRAVWVGDLAVQAPIEYLTHGRVAAVRDSLADLADHQRPDGAIPPTSYNDYKPILYDYCAWWVQSFVDYFRYTGDRAFAERYYPNLARQMAWFLTITDTNGLLARDQGIEWFWTTPRPGEVTYLNAVYYEALRDAAALATWIGHPDDAATWTARADALKPVINARLFDSQRGVYISHFGDRHVTQDANVLSILYGIAPEGATPGILAFLEDHLWTAFGATTVDVPFGTNSYHDKRIWPFMGYFELEARFSAGDDLKAFDLMRREWGQMLQVDPASTDWEWMTADGKIEDSYASLAHGWSAGATAALSQDVLGVRPLAPGYRRLEVIPHLGDLDWVKGRVPTPLGSIDVSWQRSDAGISGTLVIPQGARATVGVPTFGVPVDVTVDGRSVWHGDRTPGGDATTDGRYVYLDLGSGAHDVRALPTGSGRTS